MSYPTGVRTSAAVFKRSALKGLVGDASGLLYDRNAPVNLDIDEAYHLPATRIHSSKDIQYVAPTWDEAKAGYSDLVERDLKNINKRKAARYAEEAYRRHLIDGKTMKDGFSYRSGDFWKPTMAEVQHRAAIETHAEQVRGALNTMGKDLDTVVTIEDLRTARARFIKDDGNNPYKSTRVFSSGTADIGDSADRRYEDIVAPLDTGAGPAHKRMIGDNIAIARDSGDYTHQIVKETLYDDDIDMEYTRKSMGDIGQSTRWSRHYSGGSGATEAYEGFGITDIDSYGRRDHYDTRSVAKKYRYAQQQFIPEQTKLDVADIPMSYHYQHRTYPSK